MVQLLLLNGAHKNALNNDGVRRFIWPLRVVTRLPY